MKNHLKNNILIYIATLGILAFIPIIADNKINSFNLLSFVFGLFWVLFFIFIWLIRNTKCSLNNTEWIKSETHTGYYRFKNILNKSDFKILGLPCKLITKNVIFYSESDIIKLEKAPHIEYVKRK